MTEYVPPKVWTWDNKFGGRFANINRPIAGPTHDKSLSVGKHPFQLYSLGTPNGVKVTVMLEELLAAGHTGAEYDAWLINIGSGDQFSSGFVAANPNSKIPAMVDHSTNPPTRLFESGAMLLYLAENSARSCQPITMPVRRPCAGCSGKWALPQCWAAVSAIFMPMPPPNRNIRSTVMPWR